MRLRKYCATDLDRGTPIKYFWTLYGAMRWRDEIGGDARVYRWHTNLRTFLECYPDPFEVSIGDEELAHLEQCLSNPKGPSPAILEGQALLRKLRRQKDTPDAR